jgi:hypothetical protein
LRGAGGSHGLAQRLYVLPQLPEKLFNNFLGGVDAHASDTVHKRLANPLVSPELGTVLSHEIIELLFLSILLVSILQRRKSF